MHLVEHSIGSGRPKVTLTGHQTNFLACHHVPDLVQSNHFLNECEFQPYPQTLVELLFFKLYVEAILNKRKE